MSTDLQEDTDNPCPDGYQVKYVPHFEIHAHEVVGHIEVWDDIIRGHEWALTRDPFRRAEYIGSRWIRWFNYGGEFYILAYSIDLDNCEVEVTEVVRLT